MGQHLVDYFVILKYVFRLKSHSYLLGLSVTLVFMQWIKCDWLFIYFVQ